MDNDNFFYIDESLMDIILQDHEANMPSPDEIMEEQKQLKESALEKLKLFGLTEEEARAVVGI